MSTPQASQPTQQRLPVAGPKTNRIILKLATDVPFVCVLEDAAGEEKPSQVNGVEWRYPVQHENAPSWIYLPREGKEALQRSLARAGDEVEILKSRSGPGYAFRVQVLAPPQPAFPLPTSRPPAQPQPAEQLLRACFEMSGRAQLEAWQTLARAGLQFAAPAWEDVRVAAISLYLDLSRGS